MTTVTPPTYVLKSEEQYTKGYDPKVTRRLIEFLSPYRWRLLFALFLMLVGSSVAVAGPYFVKIALDSGIGAGNLTVLRVTILIYLGALCLQWLATYIRVNIMAVVGQSIIYELRG